MLVLGLSLYSCKEITKATDLITQPTARERYARNFNTDSVPYLLWEQEYSQSLYDSIEIKLPYIERGRFWNRVMTSSGYEIDLYEGEFFHSEIETDSLNATVFLDLLKVSKDTINPLEQVSQNEPESNNLDFKVEQSGTYKLIVQPAMATQTPFTLKVYRTPAYTFPVAGKGNAAIQSFWGARRDGGQRSHEGLDIFADRGTPVVAAYNGRVRNTGNRGLGGKQVWVRGDLFGHSLYYAHLDSIAARDGQRVKTGDTLGFVGNTGNARTTPPHLHFGIYKSGAGAINPQPFIFEAVAPKPTDLEINPNPTGIVGVPAANLRSSSLAKSKKLGRLQQGDTVQILGRSADWYHIRTKEKKGAFIYHTLIKEVGN